MIFIIDKLINLLLEIKIIWIMNGFALLGALEGCKKKVNLLKMNFLYTIANIYLIYYFISINELPLICLQICFGVFSVRGIIINLKTRKRNKKI